jgi:carbonic anhydrase
MKITPLPLRTTLVLLALPVAGAYAQDPEFSYNGDAGPKYWHELSSAWADCRGQGPTAMQSPIDLGNAEVDSDLEDLDLQIFPATVDIFNNGHTIEQRYEGTGSTIFFDGRDFELSQFHFHTESEHTITAEHSRMELHAVFGEVGGNNNLVIGVLFFRGDDANPMIQTLIDAGLPKKDGDESQSTDAVNLAHVLTDTGSYYTYSGSLTTPPCSETVTWIVLKQRAEITHQQYQEFRDILGNNFRPRQLPKGREVRATGN